MTQKAEDIRWKQRFENYRKALSVLTKFYDKKNLSDLEEQGLIKAFEYTWELAWNTMKDYLEYQGISGIIGSRGAVREAFRNDLIRDGERWMSMLESRNKTSDIYNEEVARDIAKAILTDYYPLFLKFAKTMADKN